MIFQGGWGDRVRKNKTLKEILQPSQAILCPRRLRDKSISIKANLIPCSSLWPQKKHTQSRNHLKTVLETRLFSLNIWSLITGSEERNEGLYLNCILLPSYGNQDEFGAYRVVKIGQNRGKQHKPFHTGCSFYSVTLPGILLSLLFNYQSCLHASTPSNCYRRRHTSCVPWPSSSSPASGSLLHF